MNSYIFQINYMKTYDFIVFRYHFMCFALFHVVFMIFHVFTKKSKLKAMHILNFYGKQKKQ